MRGKDNYFTQGNDLIGSIMAVGLEMDLVIDVSLIDR